MIILTKSWKNEQFLIIILNYNEKYFIKNDQ
jgi:hypothetical protein